MTTAAMIPDATQRESRKPLFRARQLAKSFGRTEALRGVDCEIAEGEVLAVMGPSGSGKSTLLHCLAGILLADSGTASYDGVALGRLDEGQRSRLRLTDFGFVFQHGQLVPDLSAVENVALPLLLRGERRGPSMEIARRWLAELELGGFEQRLPGELSGGQAQRVALARAFAIAPRVIFADEPTGSLDSLAGEAVMELLTGAARNQGVTVVLVTHDARVAAYADREIVVRDGRIGTGSAQL